MANQYTETNEAQEMDLQDLFRIIKRGFYSIIALLFKAVDFFLKFWWVILVLAILGYALGHFTTSGKSFASTLIVKTNYNSQAYVYNAVEQFDNYLGESENEEFLKRVGLDPEDPIISEVTISPIIDVVSLIENVKNERAMSAIIEEIELEDDESLFASEEFYSNFDYHKLEVKVRGRNAEKALQAMIDYINNQAQIKKISESSKINFIERITINNASLRQIDDVIKTYTESVDYANKTAKETGFYNNENTLNIRELFTAKKEITDENALLKDEIATMEGAVYVVSDVQFKEEKSFTKSKSFKYIVLFVGLFLLIVFIRFCYVSLRRGLAQMETDLN